MGKETALADACKMTDFLEGTRVELEPGKRICLMAGVTSDGIGDLEHQMKAYRELNQLYPGRVICHTYTEHENAEAVKKLCDARGFTTEQHSVMSTAENQEGITEDNTQLVFIISSNALIPNAYKADADNKKPRSYYLKEIAQGQTLDTDLTSTHQMGFLPAGQGIWLEQTQTHSDKASFVLNLSPDMKKAFNCEHLSTETEASQWLNETWISQSHYYDKQNFMISFIAQLAYIQKKSPNISNFILKYNEKGRMGKEAWNLEELLDKKMLFDLNVHSVRIGNDKTIVINPEGKVKINLVRNKLSEKDYAAMQRLMNGILLPGGDNTYSEAWSNQNTALPPLPELRSYKLSSIDPVFEIISTLDLDENEKTNLQELYHICDEINRFLPNLAKKLMENDERDGTDTIYNLPRYQESVVRDFSQRLAACWANFDDIHGAWVCLHAAIQKHNLYERLPSIIAEQVLFAKYPELAKMKLSVIKGETKLNDYQNALEALHLHPATPASIPSPINNVPEINAANSAVEVLQHSMQVNVENRREHNTKNDKNPGGAPKV